MDEKENNERFNINDFLRKRDEMDKEYFRKPGGNIFHIDVSSQKDSALTLLYRYPKRTSGGIVEITRVMQTILN